MHVPGIKGVRLYSGLINVAELFQAVRLDHTEVTLWQRLGAAAIKIKDFELALVAFQEVILQSLFCF